MNNEDFKSNWKMYFLIIKNETIVVELLEIEFVLNLTNNKKLY